MTIDDLKRREKATHNAFRSAEKSLKVIGRARNRSYKTIEAHLQRIKERFGFRYRIQLLIAAVEARMQGGFDVGH